MIYKKTVLIIIVILICLQISGCSNNKEEILKLNDQIIVLDQLKEHYIKSINELNEKIREEQDYNEILEQTINEQEEIIKIMTDNEVLPNIVEIERISFREDIQRIFNVLEQEQMIKAIESSYESSNEHLDAMNIYMENYIETIINEDKLRSQIKPIIQLIYMKQIEKPSFVIQKENAYYYLVTFYQTYPISIVYEQNNVLRIPTGDGLISDYYCEITLINEQWTVTEFAHYY